MKHISLDGEPDTVKEFVRALRPETGGSVLEINGAPVVRVYPPDDDLVDEEQLRAAIIARRDESRRLNEDWEPVDREVWGRSGD